VIFRWRFEFKVLRRLVDSKHLMHFQKHGFKMSLAWRGRGLNCFYFKSTLEATPGDRKCSSRVSLICRRSSDFLQSKRLCDLVYEPKYDDKTRVTQATPNGALSSVLGDRSRTRSALCGREATKNKPRCVIFVFSSRLLLARHDLRQAIN